METILCVTSYFKGEEFMREAKRQGCAVILLTEEKLRDAEWPRESIDEVFLMPNLSKMPDVIYAVAYLARSKKIDLIIPLDEYDVEMAALLREHLRLDGLNFSQTRYFRDKLAMRMKTHAAGILVPPFTPVIHHGEVQEYMSHVEPPWVLKPRLEAGAMGIKKVYHQDELWGWLNTLGDQQSFRVLEKYIPGDVYHVDSIIDGGEILFASVQKYGAPPMDVAHGGGVFITRTLAPESEDARQLKSLNAQVIAALGLMHGVTHAEFIHAHEDGRFYFLEIAARVGGANIADLVQAAVGFNLWGEWAKLEIAHLRGQQYHLPPVKGLHAGLMICLAKQEYPELSGYQDPEIVWRLHKKQHAGLIVVAEDEARISDLITSYQPRFVNDFLAVAPPKDKPTD